MSTTIYDNLKTDEDDNRVLLINNAGVCLEGNNLASLKESLNVNCLGPAILTEIFISKYSTMNEMNPTIENIMKNQLVVINVSSGEGELAFLHSDIQKKISSIETYKVRRKKTYLDPK